MKKKRADANYLILVIVIIIIIISGTSLKYLMTKGQLNNPEKAKSPWQKIEKDNTNSSVNSNNQNSLKPNSENENLKKDESSGGGGNGGTKAEGTTTISNPEECSPRELTYSIVTLENIEECEIYQDEYCIQKRVYCSAKIKNSDDLRGIAQMELTFFPETQTKTDSKYKITKNYTLEAKKSVIMQGEVTIESSTEDGTANQKINCFFNTLSKVESIC